MQSERSAVVYLTPVVPAGGGNGLGMRAGLFLEGMARSHSVTVVVVPLVGSPPSDLAFVRARSRLGTTLELADPTVRRDTVRLLLSTPGGRARAGSLYPLPDICGWPSAEGLKRLRALIEEADLVHIMRSYVAPCVDFLFDDDDRPPVTLDLDELDSSVQRQLGCEDEAERFERIERYFTSRVDHVYTASDSDRRAVQESYGVHRVTTVVNAVPRPLPIDPVEPDHDLLFVGSLSYQPNVDAARWLCEEIRPRLGRATIALVGSRPGPEIRRIARLPGVTVAPDVPEVGPWYSRSRVAVAPLRAGGGTRIKIIEALAHGRPVVATPVGAAGLEVGEDRGVLVAETADEFAAACRRLLDDPAAAARIGAAGPKHAPAVECVAGEIDLLTRGVLLRTAGSRRRTRR